MAAIHSRDRLDILGWPARSHGRSSPTDSFRQGLPRLAPCTRPFMLSPRLCQLVDRSEVLFETPLEGSPILRPNASLPLLIPCPLTIFCITSAHRSPSITYIFIDTYSLGLCCCGLQHFPTLPPSYHAAAGLVCANLSSLRPRAETPPPAPLPHAGPRGLDLCLRSAVGADRPSGSA